MNTPLTHPRLLALPILLSILLLLTITGTATAAADCPNQQAREQNNSTLLPDCRAYEMVSPLDKNGADIPTLNDINTLGFAGVVQSTPDGSKITYHSLGAFGENPGGLPVQSQYLSTHTPSTWTTENITAPTHTPNTLVSTALLPYEAFDTDLTEGLLNNGVELHETLEEPPLGGAPAGYRDYLLHNFATDVYQALLTRPPPETPEAFNINTSLKLEGYATTPDLHRVILSSKAELVHGVTLGGQNLYEWADGHLEPINIPPGATNGETSIPANLGSLSGNQSHTLSDDGSRAFWSIGGSGLYARENIGTPQARTIQIDGGLGGGGVFLTASSNGSKVFLTTGERRGDLYEYDLEKPESEALTDFTPTPHPGEAKIQGILGASEDGSYLYFVASGALAPGATSQECQIGNPAAGCNLYLWHAGGGITFIARLTGADENSPQSPPAADDWASPFYLRTARVSPDGQHVVFLSNAPLTPFDNAGVEEIYEYSAGSPGPVCASCNPDGAKPVGPSSIPGATQYERGSGSAVYAPRVLSADGTRVFFNSGATLSSADTNNKQDVYEWESPNSGSCAQPSGCVSLISQGTSSEGSTFLDASESGGDVFFTTRQPLTPGDTDQQVDIYDAHENGGYTIANPPECTGTGCQGLPSAQPIFATPPTATFHGVGNYPPTKPPTPKQLTRAQKLARALKACAKSHASSARRARSAPAATTVRKQRAACEKRARRKYGPVHRTAGK